MPGLAKELHEEICFTIQPLGTHMKTMSDEDIIYDISMFEARHEFCRWTINQATVAYYDHLIAEWEYRHENKHIPRLAFSREEILQQFTLNWPDQEEDE